MAHVCALSERAQGDQARATLDDLTVVASLLERVTYGSGDLSSDDLARAHRAGRRARKAILAGALVPAVDPVPAVGPERRPDQFADS